RAQAEGQVHPSRAPAGSGWRRRARTRGIHLRAFAELSSGSSFPYSGSPDVPTDGAAAVSHTAAVSPRAIPSPLLGIAHLTRRLRAASFFRGEESEPCRYRRLG